MDSNIAATPSTDAGPSGSGATAFSLQSVHPTDLTEIYLGSPATEVQADIIFVHGLMGHPVKTWLYGPLASDDEGSHSRSRFSGLLKSKKKAETWPSNIYWPLFLPRIGNFRIMTYGYDSHPVHLFSPTNQMSITNHAEQLMTKVNWKRTDCLERPIIFVSHSLGGILVKAAINESSRSTGPASDLAKSCRAIFFFGTPHMGSSAAQFGLFIKNIIKILPLAPAVEGKILQGLSPGSQDLYNITRDFNSFIDKDTVRRLKICCIQEGSAISGLKGLDRKIVSDDSSCLNRREIENKFFIQNANHMAMCRFRSTEEPGYRDFCSQLSEYLQELEVEKALLDKKKHHYAVPLETVHTYTERAKLSAEIEQKMKIRHEKGKVPYAVALHGLGGAGKSQLALAYAEKHKDRYNPILWIDATDEEAVRSSFRRCAAELGIPEEPAEKQESVLTDRVVEAVRRWLRHRTEADDEWLVIVDNADDVSWGIQKIMPEGNRGGVIVTSQDDRSVRLVPGACEPVHVGVMSPVEGVALLLQHLQLGAESASEGIRRDCDKIAQRLGYLALAIDLAGAYIGNNSAPKHALSQYLADYDRHRDELLQMDSFQGLLPTQKTVWTVWDTTLEKIRREYSNLQPNLLLTFLAQFKGSIMQHELFRLACLGMTMVDAELDGEANEVMPAGLRQFLPLDKGEWDSFRYRQSRDVLVRYNILQQVEGQWPGVTMHSLVQWRARQNEPDQPWRWWYLTFILAACCQITGGKEQPEFRRHLVVHLPDISENDAVDGDQRRHNDFVGSTLGRVYYDEGRWEEAEKLFVQVMETCKTKLGADHPDTLTSMANLASTYRNQGRWEEAEKLDVQVMETRKTKLGADHPDTLTSMNNLALTYMNQGRWKEAEKLEVQVMETRKTKLGADHPDTLTSMNNLAFTWKGQGRRADALALMENCAQARRQVLGEEHPYTLSSLAAIAEWSS